MLKSKTSPTGLKILTVAFTAVALTWSCARTEPVGDRSAKDGGESEATSDDNWVDAEVDAENLADEGEDLLSFETIDRAEVKFKEALKLDSTNARADIWSHFILSVKELRGIVPRIRPFIESLPDGKRRYRDVIASTQGVPDKNFRNFLMTKASGDITTAKEFQEQVDRLNLRADELRAAFVRHKTEEIRLMIPISFFGKSSDSFISTGSSACEMQSFGPIQFQNDDCSEKGAQILLNQADSEAIIAALAMMQAYFALANAYQINPELLPKIEKAGKMNDISILADAGIQLRSNTVLKNLGLGLQDFATGLKYIIDNQEAACPKGHYISRNRPGTLFPYGLCNEGQDKTETDRIVRILDQIIANQPVTIFHNLTDETVDIDWVKLLNSPPQTLKSFVDKSPNQPTCEKDAAKIAISGFQPYVTQGNIEEFWTTVRTQKCKRLSEAQP